MVDTVRQLAALQGLLPDNSTREISPQDVRDFLVSALPTGRSATKVVAAATASDLQKAQADYVCDGTADDVQIQAAIDAAATAGGGTVLLTDGTFTTAAPLTPKANVVIRGQGPATIVKLANGTGGEVVFGDATIANVGLESLTLDGNGANQPDGASRNDGAACHLRNVTHLWLDKVIIQNARSGAGLLIAGCAGVRLHGLRMLTNGKSATGGFEADHTYLGDCYYVTVSDYYAHTCTDTGLAIEGCRYVAVNGYMIHTPGAGSQCLSVSTSPSQTPYHVSIGPGVLVGAGGTTYGVRIGRFGSVGDPTNINLTGLNISGVKYGISIDEGVRVECANNHIKLDTIAGAFGYWLGAGAALVNVNGGRVYEATFAQGTGIRFESGCTLPAFAGLDLQGIPTKFSGAPPAGTVFSMNPGLATRKSGVTSVADGGTIAHGLVTTPTRVVCTPTTSGEMVSVTALAATTFTVAIKKHDGSAGTTANVYWEAELVF